MSLSGWQNFTFSTVCLFTDMMYHNKECERNESIRMDSRYGFSKIKANFDFMLMNYSILYYSCIHMVLKYVLLVLTGCTASDKVNQMILSMTIASKCYCVQIYCGQWLALWQCIHFYCGNYLPYDSVFSTYVVWFAVVTNKILFTSDFIIYFINYIWNVYFFPVLCHWNV